MIKKIIKALGIISYSLIAITIIGELMVSKLRPQAVFSEVYKYADKCYESSLITPFTLTKGTTCNFKDKNGDFDTNVVINSLGYRGEEFDIEKKEDEYRVLVLGDSFVFGYGVEDDQTIPYKLERLLTDKLGKNVTVINAGFHAGFSPDSYYAYLKSNGYKLQPDLIILMLFPYNDLPDLFETAWREVDEFGLPTSVYSTNRVVDNGIFRYTRTDIEYQYPVLRESHFFHFLVTTLRNNFGLFKIEHFPTEGSYKVGCALDHLCIDILLRDQLENTYKLMEGINYYSSEQGSDFFITIIPTDYQIYPEAFEKYNNTRPVNPENRNYFQKRFTKQLTKKGIKYLDLYESLTREDVKKRGYPFFPKDAHFSDLGTTIVSEELLNYLTQNNIISY